MSQLQAYLSNLEMIREQTAELRSQADHIKKCMVEQFCPVKVGDRVIANYLHAGKQIEVFSVYVYSTWEYIAGVGYEKPAGFACKGKVVKKDGTVGVVQGGYKIAFKDIK